MSKKLILNESVTRRFMRLAEIESKFTDQFLTELGDKGVNARVIQALARHKHLSTTQRYIDYNESKLRRAVELMEIV